MADAKSRYDWNHTAGLMALIANCNRDPKKRRQPFNTEDFHPDGERKTRKRTKDLSILRKVFVEKA